MRQSPRTSAAQPGLAMSQNVPKCPEMSYPKAQISKSNPPRSRGLSPRQLAGVRLLLAGHSAGAVARALGVDRRTVFRWRQSATFAAEMDRILLHLAPVVSRPKRKTPSRLIP